MQNMTARGGARMAGKGVVCTDQWSCHFYHAMLRRAQY